jgi:histidine ammonia-lyase
MPRNDFIAVPLRPSRTARAICAGSSAAAVKLRRSVRNLRHVLAIELIAAAEGLEYRRPLQSSTPVEAAHRLIRSQVARQSGDRSPAPDITRLGDALAAGLLDSITDGLIA